MGPPPRSVPAERAGWTRCARRSRPRRLARPAGRWSAPRRRAPRRRRRRSPSAPTIRARCRRAGGGPARGARAAAVPSRERQRPPAPPLRGVPGSVPSPMRRPASTSPAHRTIPATHRDRVRSDAGWQPSSRSPTCSVEHRGSDDGPSIAVARECRPSQRWRNSSTWASTSGGVALGGFNRASHPSMSSNGSDEKKSRSVYWAATPARMPDST